ncbi:hypothetical protein RRG08_007659 [Elysia crispata]|uniref:Uncharacterized protein n=1 Tax=Elysia crispata TaxID=231223 RepID=A0AAE0Y4A4_9GAST|nr:hypothetical protein RRG08_007659 [Elysia crispata]
MPRRLHSVVDEDEEDFELNKNQKLICPGLKLRGRSFKIGSSVVLTALRQNTMQGSRTLTSWRSRLEATPESITVLDLAQRGDNRSLIAQYRKGPTWQSVINVQLKTAPIAEGRARHSIVDLIGDRNYWKLLIF